MTEKQTRDAQTFMAIIALIFMLLQGQDLPADEIEIRGATSVRLGDYTLQLDGKTTVWIDTDAGTVRVGKPGPPPKPPPDDPPPDTGISSLEGIARRAFDAITGEGSEKLSRDQRAKIAAVFSELPIGPTELASNESEIQQATNERIRRILRIQSPRVSPAMEAIYKAVNDLRDAGTINSVGDWAKAWKAIGRGVRP